MTKQKQINLRKQVIPFENSNVLTSSWQVVNTIIPYLFLWYLAYLSLAVSYLLTLAIAVIAAGFLVRTFIIFHDCCHHSFFKSRMANKVLGTITGIMTFFPYHKWAHEHSVHHATSSNLDKRGTGDIWMLTVNEYVSAPLWLKFCYRFYRNPFVMFLIGPIYVFLLKNRFNRKGARKKERLNLYFTNFAIVAWIWLLVTSIGWEAFLLVQTPIFMISGAAGIWLFYVQHTFEDSYFEVDEYWDFVKAAVEGSSFYKLPKVLQWLTGNIGYHHVHHLSPKVPNYKLEEAHKKTPMLQQIPTITLKTSFACLKFGLWDESTERFVQFKDTKEIVKMRSVSN